MRGKIATVLVGAALATGVGLIATSQASAAYSLGWSACANPTSTTCDPSFTVPQATMCTPGTTTPCVVYDKTAQKCDDFDHADQPMRAFRFKNSATNPEYRVSLNSATPGAPAAPEPPAPPDGNRRLVGPRLESVKRENDPAQPPGEFRGCSENVILSSHRQQIPDNFDNYEFLDSPYFVESSPGSGLGDVYGFIHNEFHGELLNPNVHCPPSLGLGLNDCWYSSITLATSQFSQQPSIVNKVGSAYAHPSGSKLVASIPYQYDPPTEPGQSNAATEGTRWGRHGYVAPTNVIRATLPGQPEAYYMLSLISGQRGAQKAGICALRTTNLSDPDAWRAWGGEPPGWTVDLVSPYPPPGTPANHVCTPISPKSLVGLTPRSVYWNRQLNKFTLVGDVAGGGPVAYAMSDDLINWSKLQTLMVDGPQGACSEGAGYTSMLDRTDPAGDGLSGPTDEPTVTPNFDHPGRRPYLFFVRSNTGDCEQTSLDRDIVRVPIRLEARRAILDGGISGTDDSYDSTAAGSPSSFVSGGGGDYENEGTVRHASATTNIADASSPRWAYGTLNLTGGALNDDTTNGFWYSSAFFLPKDQDNCANDFICENTTVDIMRWESPGSGSGAFFSGIRLKGGTNRFHLVRGSGTPGTVSTDIGDPFDLPTGRTFWLEVHQDLSNTNGAALNEVYVDGRLVMSSTAANRGAETSGPDPTHVTDTSAVKKVKYGFVHNLSPVGTNSVVALDSSSVTGGQLGALFAPATPTGLRVAFEGSTYIALVSNPVVGDATHPTPTAYRWHRRPAGSATWQWIAETTSPSLLDFGVTCGNDYEYRITTVWQPGANTPEIDKKESIPSERIDANTAGC